MIAFGCAVSEPEAYRRYCEPGIRLAAEPDSEIFAFAAVDGIARSYNLLLDAVAGREDLEALVLVHPHTEIADRDLCQKVRTALADPSVAVVGCAGASDVRSIAWWQGSVSCGHVTHRYTDHGGGGLPAFSWSAPSPAPAEVDTVDGFLMVLSPWVVRRLHFDESLVHGHGFDLDFCLQARAAGGRVTTADLTVVEHRSLELIADPEIWTEAHIATARKWPDAQPEPAQPTSWKDRARRAEAEREASRALAYFRRLMFDARVAELERDLAEATTSVSWQLTMPLRRANRWRRQRDAGPGVNSR